MDCCICGATREFGNYEQRTNLMSCEQLLLVYNILFKTALFLPMTTTLKDTKETKSQLSNISIVKFLKISDSFLFLFLAFPTLSFFLSSYIYIYI